MTLALPHRDLPSARVKHGETTKWSKFEASEERTHMGCHWCWQWHWARELLQRNAKRCSRNPTKHPNQEMLSSKRMHWNILNYIRQKLTESKNNSRSKNQPQKLRHLTSPYLWIIDIISHRLSTNDPMSRCSYIFHLWHSGLHLSRWCGNPWSNISFHKWLIKIIIVRNYTYPGIRKTIIFSASPAKTLFYQRFSTNKTRGQRFLHISTSFDSRGI